jgi:hypothetical protein
MLPSDCNANLDGSETQKTYYEFINAYFFPIVVKFHIKNLRKQLNAKNKNLVLKGRTRQKDGENDIMGVLYFVLVSKKLFGLDYQMGGKCSTWRDMRNKYDLKDTIKSSRSMDGIRWFREPSVSSL